MSGETTRRAGELRAAFQIVSGAAPEGADRTDVLRRLGLLIASLEGDPLRLCRSCRTRFHLSAGEVRFYTKRGLSLPTHCRDCRAHRRLCRREDPDGPP